MNLIIFNIFAAFVFKNNKNANLTQYMKRNKNSSTSTSDRTSRVQHRPSISERREKKYFRLFWSQQIQEKSIPHSSYSIYKFNTLKKQEKQTNHQFWDGSFYFFLKSV